MNKILTITTTIKSEEHEYEVVSDHLMNDRHKDFSDALNNHSKLFEKPIEWNQDNLIISNGCGDEFIRQDFNGLIHQKPFKVGSRLRTGKMEVFECKIVLNPDGSEHPSTVKKLIKGDELSGDQIESIISEFVSEVNRLKMNVSIIFIKGQYIFLSHQDPEVVSGTKTTDSAGRDTNEVCAWGNNNSRIVDGNWEGEDFDKFNSLLNNHKGIIVEFLKGMKNQWISHKMQASVRLKGHQQVGE